MRGTDLPVPPSDFIMRLYDASDDFLTPQIKFLCKLLWYANCSNVQDALVYKMLYIKCFRTSALHLSIDASHLHLSIDAPIKIACFPSPHKTL